MATLKQRFAKQTKAVLPMTWGKPQVPGVVPLMATNKGNVAETPIPREELLTSSESGTLRSPVEFSKGHTEPPLLDKLSVDNRLPKRYLEPPLSDKVSSSELLQPTSRSLRASFTAKQVSDDHWSIFPDAHSLASHFANIDFHSIGDYFKSIPQELFYFHNPSQPNLKVRRCWWTFIPGVQVFPLRVLIFCIPLYIKHGQQFSPMDCCTITP
jgi:hypothetical protein